MTKFVDVEMTGYSNENELHIKEEIDITTEEYDQEQIDHALTCDMVVKVEGSGSSCDDPELEVLRVESPKLTTRLQRLIARRAQKVR